MDITTNRPTKADNLRVIARRTAEQRASLTVALYKRNADALDQMLRTSEATGQRVGGYTAEQLRGHAAAYRLMAQGLPV